MDTGEAQKTKPARSGSRLLVFVLLLIGLAVASQLLPLKEWSVVLQEKIRALGWLAPVAYVIIYVIFTLLLIVPIFLSLISGHLFGWKLGVLLSLTGANIGALLAFLLARTVMRQRVDEWAKLHPGFSAVDDAFATNGFKLVLLLRLAPLPPFVTTNYLLGLTRVPLWKYVLATLIGMPLITSIVVYIGLLPAEAASEIDQQKRLLWLLGGAALITASMLITYYARKAIHKKAPSIDA